MDKLNKEQRDILLDYYFECAGQQESETAKELLETHQGAIEFYNRLHHSLSALEHLDHEVCASCPDHLVEKTLDKLYSHTAKTEPISQLDKLLHAESEKVVTKRPSFWRNFAEAAAVAAGVVILSGIFVPVTKQMRAMAWQAACQANLAKIAQGITGYANENSNFLPAVATKAGNPWWKVGSTQPQHQSNTRHVWVLVKNNYAEPQLFVCPGGTREKLPALSQTQIANLSDFPNRRYITYSFKLISEPNKAKYPLSAAPLMSDTNPIFETCLQNPGCVDKNEFDPITLSEKLLKINSTSHRGKGQNVMFSDGAVRFTSQRVFGSDDDIFTVKDRQVYRGTETTSSETDVFLVP
ncbi:MAG: hypothetical protein CVV39_07115 [Planctomycetes bacterium HGW-Planctomycetes-1]|nr:MAG: hypothetical protein CVV39_07115 [Planctomycetes bacterium HGW-Planctomycetes-1]